MIIKMRQKISFHSLIAFVLFITLSFFGAAFLFSLASPPAYGQTVNAWNLHRQGANDLNFYYNNGVNQPIALQLNTNGQMRASKILDLDTGQQSYFIDPGNTGTSLSVAGSVGIGTTSPTAKFNISGAHTDTLAIMHSSGAGTGGAAEADLAFWASEPGCTYQGVGIGNNVRNYTGVSTGGNICYPRISTARGGSYIHFYESTMDFRTVTNAGADSPGFYLNTTGVGIGTTSPGKKLEVKGTGTDGIRIQRAAAAQDTELTFSNEAATDNWFFHANGSVPEQMFIYPSAGSQNLILQTNEAGTALGNVGVGTTTPGQKLSVLSADNTETTNIAGFLANNQTAGVGIGFYNVRQIYAGQPIYVNAGTSGMVHVGNVSTGGVSLATAGGNVGISTTAPQNKLHVGGFGNGDGIVFYSPADDTLALQTQLNGQLYSSGYGGDPPNRLILQPVVGYVGIGTNTPSQKLHVAGNILANGTITANFPAVPANTICRDSAGLLGSCSSDRRLKDNIKPIAVSGLDIISKLKPSTFDYKSGLKDQSGFIAQDVLEVLPQAVTTSSDGYYGLNDNIFTPYLVKAIQELNEDNKLLKQNLQSQQQQIELLKQEIELLKNK